VARERSTNRSIALKLWLKSNREMKLTEIADELGTSAALIRKWKFSDKWDEIPLKRPRGAQTGNKNAIGNKGGPGGSKPNIFFQKFLPDDSDYKEIMDMINDMDPLDMLWHNIAHQFGAIVRAQRIMFVESKQEMIKELKKRKSEVHDIGVDSPVMQEFETEVEYEFQFSWDRYATYLKAQSVAMAELRGAIKQFLNAAPENDERRAKLSLMQAQVKKVEAEVDNIKGGGKNSEAEDWVAALKQAAEKRKSRVKADE
jgi:uncharacterized protein YjcR